MGVFQILDLIIGVTFIYFLLSLICVALQEIKARQKKERSENLRKWIYDTFNKDGGSSELGMLLWNNIIIDGLTQDGKAAAYIPKEVFVSALLDEIHYASDDKSERKEYTKLNKIKNDEVVDINKPRDQADQLSIESLAQPFDFLAIGQSIEKSDLLPLRIKRVLRQIHSESFNNMESFRDRLERWFDQAMERNAGTFKKEAQKSVLIFACIVTVLLNVDSIKLIKYFHGNPEVAARVADAAERMIKDPNVIHHMKQESSPLQDSTSVKAQVIEIKGYLKKLNQLELPIGWGNESWENFIFDTSGWKRISLVGWLITVFAVSLGAPFWYDTLNKLVDLRSAGKKPSSLATGPQDVKSSTETVG